MMRRLVAVLAVVFLTVSGELTAQEADQPAGAAAETVRTDLKADVRRLLMSETVVDQAWGAYYAGKYGFTDLAPLLWSLIDPDKPDFTNPQQRCIQNALIDLGATADAENFELLLKKHWNVCALRAAINGKSAEQLITLMREVPYTDIQIAVCNKLVDMKQAELSKELLSRVSIALNIHVETLKVTVKKGDGTLTGGGWGTALTFADGSISVPTGFPPIVDYTLVRSHPKTGDILLAGGPTNIYLRRREQASTSMGIGAVSSGFDLVNYKLASFYTLRVWQKPGHKTTLSSNWTTTIAWTTADAFETSVAEKVNNLKKEWRELRAALVKDKLLTEEDAAALSIDISLSISDHRDKKTPALPPAKELEAKLFGVK